VGDVWTQVRCPAAMLSLVWYGKSLDQSAGQFDFIEDNLGETFHTPRANLRQTSSAALKNRARNSRYGSHHLCGKPLKTWPAAGERSIDPD